MKLYRSELINFEDKWEKDNNNYMLLLDGLLDIISKHDYESDSRFVTYGRRDFLRQEFSDYLNGIAFSGRGKYNDAFIDLSEYYHGPSGMSIASVSDPNDFNRIDREYHEYLNDGVICLEEIEIIKDMIEEFKSHLNGK